MRVLVTGGGGILGTALGRTRPVAITLDSRRHAELDVADRAATLAAIGAARPDVVIHGAAFTDVDGCEKERAKALRVNGEGTANVADAALAIGARLFVISSDYVFDGTKRTPYVEEDATAPLSVYGESKLLAEHEALQRGPRVAVVRTQWVYGAGGRNFVDTILAAAKSKPELRVVADQIGSPTWSVDLAQGLWRLVEAGVASDRLPGSGGVWHLSASGVTSWFGFARAIVTGAGLATPVLSCTTADFPRPARRPAYGVLENRRLVQTFGDSMPPWEAGLRGYLRDLGFPGGGGGT